MHDLHQMEHRDDETSQEFLNWFLDVMNQIHDLNVEQVVMLFVQGLTSGSMLPNKRLEELP